MAALVLLYFRFGVSKMGRNEPSMLNLWQKHLEQKKEGQISGKPREKPAPFP